MSGTRKAAPKPMAGPLMRKVLRKAKCGEVQVVLYGGQDFFARAMPSATQARLTVIKRLTAAGIKVRSLSPNDFAGAIEAEKQIPMAFGIGRSPDAALRNLLLVLPSA